MVNILIYFLLILDVIVALILIGLVLIQRSKAGGGLGGLVGGAATEEVFGSGGTNVVVRATVICAVIFLGTTLSLTVLQGLRHSEISDIEKRLASGGPTAPAVIPASVATLATPPVAPAPPAGDTPAPVPPPAPAAEAPAAPAPAAVPGTAKAGG